MPRTWIIIDVSSVAYRAYYGTKCAAPEDRNLACVRGLGREVADLQTRFGTEDTVFAFDHGESLRKKIYESYKLKPANESDPVRQEARRQVRYQCKVLREDLLPRMGYRNVLVSQGYEADDLIASAVENLQGRDRAVIVSTDRDLYQLLSPDVSVYNPMSGQNLTEEGFRAAFGVRPSLWPNVRAIAGDDADNIPGAVGVGENYAARYLLRNLRPGTIPYERAGMWAGSAQYTLNLRLIKLPYPGTPVVRLVRHASVGRTDWMESVDPRPTRGIPK